LRDYYYYFKIWKNLPKRGFTGCARDPLGQTFDGPNDILAVVARTKPETESTRNKF
jgi:hypothetical protein